MNTFAKLLIVTISVAAISACAPRNRLTGGGTGVGDDGVYDPNASSASGIAGETTYVGPYDSASADAYNSSVSGFDGQVIGGPSATLEQRIVYFAYDSAEIDAQSRAVVEAHAQYLLQTPSGAMILEGHADERGSREYNIGLGERRAASVRRVMGAMGVSPQQIRLVSYGEERPAVSGAGDEQSYALNRRVEIVY